MNEAIDEVRDEIAHPFDGPVTGYVLVARAIDAAQRGGDGDVIVEALVRELKSRGVSVDQARVSESEEY
jgi:hypothetical protein